MMRHAWILLVPFFVSCGMRATDRTLEAERTWRDASRGFSADVRGFMIAYREADEAKQRAMLESPHEPRHRWTPRMRELALRYRGDPAAVRFDRWLLQNGGVIDARYADEAAARITATPMSGPRMMKVPSALRAASSFRGEAKTLSDLNEIVSASRDRMVVAEARRQIELILHPPSPAVSIGMSRPPLRGTDLNGRSVESAELRGKVILVDFWGAWCGPCVAKVPALKRVAARFLNAPFAIVGINSDHDLEMASRFVKASGMPWPNIADGGTAGPMAMKWSITRWPATFLVGRDGRVAAIDPPEESLVVTIETLIGDDRGE